MGQDAEISFLIRPRPLNEEFVSKLVREIVVKTNSGYYLDYVNDTIIPPEDLEQIIKEANVLALKEYKSLWFRNENFDFRLYLRPQERGDFIGDGTPITHKLGRIHIEVTGSNFEPLRLKTWFMKEKNLGEEAAEQESIKDTKKRIDAEIKKAKGITPAYLADKFNIRVSTAKKILREAEANNIVEAITKSRRTVVYSAATGK